MKREHALRHLLLRRISDRAQAIACTQGDAAARSLSQLAADLVIQPRPDGGFDVTWQFEGKPGSSRIEKDQFRFYQHRLASAIGGEDLTRDLNQAQADQLLSTMVGGQDNVVPPPHAANHERSQRHRRASFAASVAERCAGA